MWLSFYAPAAALAQQASAESTLYLMPRIPSEEEKIEALKTGYVLNGFSMTRPLAEGSIDVRFKMTPPPVTVRTIPITPDKSKQKPERFK